MVIVLLKIERFFMDVFITNVCILYHWGLSATIMSWGSEKWLNQVSVVFFKVIMYWLYSKNWWLLIISITKGNFSLTPLAYIFHQTFIWFYSFIMPGFLQPWDKKILFTFNLIIFFLCHFGFWLLEAPYQFFPCNFYKCTS